MADVILAGPVSIAVDGLRTLISNIPFFQSWVGVNDPTDALVSIFTGEVGNPILSISVSDQSVTIITKEPHSFLDGDTVTIEGSSIGAESSINVDGVYTVEVSYTNLSEFYFTKNIPDIAVVYPDQAFVMPGQRPIAVVSDVDEPLHANSVGTGGASIYNGTIEILLEADVSAEYQNDPKNAVYEARNSYGSFIQGLTTTQGTGDLMCLNNIEPVSGPQFTSKSEQTDNSLRFERWRATIRVGWGLLG